MLALGTSLIPAFLVSTVSWMTRPTVWKEKPWPPQEQFVSVESRQTMANIPMEDFPKKWLPIGISFLKFQNPTHWKKLGPVSAQVMNDATHFALLFVFDSYYFIGVTMFGPLKEYGARPGGKNVGIAGFGGLGQMGNHINLSPEQHLQCQGCARIQDDQDFQECLKWQKAKLGFLISIGSRVALGQGHGKQRDDRVIITQQRSYGQVYGSW